MKNEISDAQIISEEKQREVKEAQIIKLDSIDTLDSMLKYTQVLVDSKILPFTRPEQAVVAYQFGKELGLGIVTAMSNIHIIKDKPSISVHVAAALIERAGVEKRTIEDFVPYEVTYKDENGDEKVAKTKRTTIEFMRKWNGEVIIERVSLTWADVQRAGWAEKDNWKKMPKIMMWNRTLVIGARRVAPGALLGMYEASEMADIQNTTIDLDINGNPIKN